jgi:hypothetical protein
LYTSVILPSKCKMVQHYVRAEMALETNSHLALESVHQFINSSVLSYTAFSQSWSRMSDI